MKRTIIRVAAVAMVAVALAACRTAPVYNVQQSSLMATQSVSQEQVADAIRRAAGQLGWQVRPEGPGHMVGTLAVRSHMAVVDIFYNTETFSIAYKDSSNLKYSGTQIHSNYNGWVQNLEQAIRAQVAAI